MQDKISEKEENCTTQDLRIMYVLHNNRVCTLNWPLEKGNISWRNGTTASIHIQISSSLSSVPYEK